MFSFNEEMSREIIMDHVSNPRNINKKRDNYPSYKIKNPSCGDEIELFVLLENEIVKDITYLVMGCSMCKASVSILSDSLIGKSKLEVKEFVSEFNKMVMEEEYNSDILKEAVCLKGVVNVPPRIKCVTLGYKALTQLIGDDSSE